MNACLACQLNNDPSSVPGGRIKNYNHWLLEHIIEPIPVKGWLILKTKRHAEGITDLNTDEAKELGEILESLPKIQKKYATPSGYMFVALWNWFLICIFI